MKKALCVVATAAAVLIAAPVFAEDGNIPSTTLSSLGLGDLQPMSEAEGMQVRGESSAFAMATGTSLIFGQLVTPDTKNFLVLSDVNMVTANAESTDALARVEATKNHQSQIINGSLVISLPAASIFNGLINGIVGGVGTAIGQP